MEVLKGYLALTKAFIICVSRLSNKPRKLQQLVTWDCDAQHV